MIVCPTIGNPKRKPTYAIRDHRGRGELPVRTLKISATVELRRGSSQVAGALFFLPPRASGIPPEPPRLDGRHFDDRPLRRIPCCMPASPRLVSASTAVCVTSRTAEPRSFA